MVRCRILRCAQSFPGGKIALSSVDVIVHGRNSQKDLRELKRVLHAVGVARSTQGNITHRMSGSISSCTLTNLSSITSPLVQAISQDCWESIFVT